VLEEHGKMPGDYLALHQMGAWGQLCKEDEEMNERALKVGNRLMSVYEIAPKVTVWVITEADRSSTTILLPEDY
jgi:hypothetical protein